MVTIALFDIDGVLITPHGYRQASDAVMTIFLEQLGQPHWRPDVRIYEQFESYMITSEWDMMPLLLCAFLEHALRLVPSQVSWQTFDQAARHIRQQANLPIPEELPEWIDQIGRIVNGQSGSPSEHVSRAAMRAEFPFPRLREHPVLEDLLAHTREIHQSLTMRTFQEHIIGSALYEQTYHLPAQHHVPSFLARYDACPIQPAVFSALNEKARAGELLLSLYTARPSNPPAGIQPNGMGAYSPEAEQALELIPLSPCYLSAYGKVYWLAEHSQFTTEDLLKPSPVQALSAIAYHFVDDEIGALRWAKEVYQAYLDGDIHEVQTPSHFPPRILLHVFEDSPNGLRGGVLAAELLRFMGITVDLHLWGISENPAKQAALRTQGGQVFTDANEAIRAALLDS